MAAPQLRERGRRAGDRAAPTQDQRRRHRATPTEPRADKVLDLQRQAGNRAVVQLLERPKQGDKADIRLWDDMFDLGRRKLAAKDYAEAEQLFRGIYRDPKFTTDDSPGVVLNLALARHWQGAFKEAVELYKESLQTTQWSIDDKSTVLENLRSARLKQLPDPPGTADKGDADKTDIRLWDDMFLLARKKLAAKQLGAAERLLLDIYKDPKFKTSDSPGVVLNLGLLRHAMGDFDRAIDYYEESLLAGKYSGDDKGVVMEGLRKARQKQLLDASKSPDPVKADAADDALFDDMFKLARKKLAAKDLDGAEQLLQAIYDDPKFTIRDNAGVVLNLAYIRHVRGDYANAIERYEESLLGSDWDAAKRARTLEQLKAARLRRPPPG